MGTRYLILDTWFLNYKFNNKDNLSIQLLNTLFVFLKYLFYLPSLLEHVLLLYNFNIFFQNII